MPENPEVDLEAVKKEVKTKLEDKEAEVKSIEEEDVAFGLKAIILTMSWPEEKGTDKAEQICKVDNVKNVETIDFRRAVE